MKILKFALNIKSILKSQETRKQNLLEKQIYVTDLHQKNQQTFTKFKEIFMIVKIIIMKMIALINVLTATILKTVITGALQSLTKAN